MKAPLDPHQSAQITAIFSRQPPTEIDDTLPNVLASILALIAIATLATAAFFWKPIATWLLFGTIWLHQYAGL